MQAGQRYTLSQTLYWSRKYIFIFIIFDAAVVLIHHVFKLEWMAIPWEPIGLIGIAVAFYLGFKNNSAYERMWEARKIWGGIVNTSRSLTVMVKNYVTHEGQTEEDDDLRAEKLKIVHRHVAWLRALTIEMRKLKKWEHSTKEDNELREFLNVTFKESNFDQIKSYLSGEEFNYVMSKGNRSSHLLSKQTEHLMILRNREVIEHFRHLQMQDLITELYTLQGKSERIKNFPFPRQYATINYFFAVLFIVLLPFGMVDVFHDVSSHSWFWWFAIPFSVIGSWVFWMMEMISDSSENPFEGLYNDVPISNIARGIEIDIRQMMDEKDLPPPIEPVGEMEILI